MCEDARRLKVQGLWKKAPPLVVELYASVLCCIYIVYSRALLNEKTSAKRRRQRLCSKKCGIDRNYLGENALRFKNVTVMLSIFRNQYAMLGKLYANSLKWMRRRIEFINTLKHDTRHAIKFIRSQLLSPAPVLSFFYLIFMIWQLFPPSKRAMRYEPFECAQGLVMKLQHSTKLIWFRWQFWWRQAE